MLVKKQDAPNEMHFSNYVVSFLDLLGQADKLLATPLLIPAASQKEKREEFLKRVAGTFIPTTEIQRDFEHGFEPDLDLTERQDLPESDKALYRNFRKNHVKFQRFSDGHIAYLNLHKAKESGSSNIFNIITGCCRTMINSLSHGHPVRGGIAIGWGTEFEQSFYGAVIARAHHLESKVACYPRVVIDAPVISFLKAIIDNPHQNPSHKELDVTLAKLAHEMIWQDPYDGQWIVDYLSPLFIDNYKQCKAMSLIHDAHAFVKKEYRDHAADGSAPNTKLVMRYAMLDHYFTQRLTQAGVIQ